MLLTGGHAAEHPSCGFGAGRTKARDKRQGREQEPECGDCYTGFLAAGLSLLWPCSALPDVC